MQRTVVFVEGRDGAGKSTLVRALATALGPDARALVMPRPTRDELRGSYFGRHLSEIAKGPRVVLCDRSWYARAGVERVMGFCTPRELERFFEAAPRVEAELARAGVRLVKIYLDVSDVEQARRILSRRHPSALDVEALSRAGAYRQAAREMMLRTTAALAPWHVIGSEQPPLETLSLASALVRAAAICEGEVGE